MKNTEAINPANEAKIQQALATFFDMKLDMIGYDVNEEEEELVVWSTSPMFDSVVISLENMDI
jgi:hypothetical protein